MRKEYLVETFRGGQWNFELAFKTKREALSYAKKLAGQVRVTELLDPEGRSEPKTVWEKQ